MIFGLLGLIVIAVAIGFAFLAGRNSARDDRGSLMQAPPSLSKPRLNRMADLSTEQMAEIQALVAQGKKIEAIKQVRELTGLGLKEAKEFVERL